MSSMPDANQQPVIINCHTHIFTGESVPPYIAKTFLPWPLYQLFSIKFILSICRFWYNNKRSPRNWKHKRWYKRIQLAIYGYRSFVKRHAVTNLLISLFNLVVAYHAAAYFILWLVGPVSKPGSDTTMFTDAVQWLLDRNLLWLPASGWVRAGIIVFAFIFSSTGRKFIFFILKKIWGLLRLLPDNITVQFIIRYVNIGRFAYYGKQRDIFTRLKAQYPANTGFVVLPMDMEFMDAGRLSIPDGFKKQMEELHSIKQSQPVNSFFPFVFVDPRRKEVSGQVFFDWKPLENGVVALQPSFIKEYIEEKKFSGFKIYPALGYYPFEETLLPLWKYAADHQIPILTHCIRGTIYYRGTKKKEWGRHPLFKQAEGQNEFIPLLLPELKNRDYVNNFTHPLNYLCLVEEKLLRLLVGEAKDERIKTLFGYNGPDKSMDHDLRNLKLCFGHFGGEEEWQKYFEKDRDSFTSQMVTNPDKGLEFIKDEPMHKSYARLERIWKEVDWYTTITSLMLRYDNLYADISYIIHSDSIFPLLKQTLTNQKLQQRVLFGTDFYVVRNHKSEKDMLSSARAALSDAEFNWIAVANPGTFLKQV